MWHFCREIMILFICIRIDWLWYCGTVVLWCRGAVVPWCLGALVPWCRGGVVPWYCGAVVPHRLSVVLWCCGAVVPHRLSVVLWYCGAMVPWYHGAAAPWRGGAAVPWYRGAVLLWYCHWDDLTMYVFVVGVPGLCRCWRGTSSRVCCVSTSTTSLCAATAGLTDTSWLHCDSSAPPCRSTWAWCNGLTAGQ